MTIRLAPLVLVLSSLLALPACKHQKSCTSELTDGASLYHASAAGLEDEAELTQRATKLACARMCLPRGPDKKVACEARCGVDVTAGKIGVKSTCKPLPAQ